MGLKDNSIFYNAKRSSQYLNYSGNNIFYPIRSKLFKTSIYNSNSNNFTEFTDIDKFIISTCYSDNFKNLLYENSLFDYFEVVRSYEVFSEIIFLCLLLLMYFLGYFEQNLFLLIERITKSKFLAFNIKTISILLIADLLILTVVCVKVKLLLTGLAFDQKTNFGPNYIPDLIFFVIPSFIIILLANGIYYIEKILYPKIDQFVKQQIFSFVFLVSSLSLILLIKYQNESHQSLISSFSLVSAVLGLGLVRFFFNYSKYLKYCILMNDKKLNN